jgi:stage V sporulation protein AC
MELKMNLQEKKELIKKHSPGSNFIKNSLFAFLFGGGLCIMAQLLLNLFSSFISDEKISGALVTVTVIFISGILTAFGIFDKIAKHAGAGTLVPVSGFSNAVVSQAMDAKSEGFILGLGAKIFTVAGPVILYGISSGVLYGVIYFIFKIIKETI